MQAFLLLAVRSPTRQLPWRQFMAFHIAVLAALAVMARSTWDRPMFEVLGHACLLLGMIEGALLLGWRLAQWPKCKLLELILTSPISGPRAMLGEELAGLILLGLVTLSAAPVFAGLMALGALHVAEAVMLLGMGWLWGAVVGLGLTCWAYEPRRFRRRAERLMLFGVLAFLVLGGLLGRKTLPMVYALPAWAATLLEHFLFFLHWHSPFAAVHQLARPDGRASLPTFLLIQGGGLWLALVFLARSAFRLKPHYLEWHYVPDEHDAFAPRGIIGAWPLSWYAVKRVRRYAGAINIYLAGGFCGLYSAYLIAGPGRWPSWLGHGVMQSFDHLGGAPVMVALLAVMAAVPAAYQYGLWDSSDDERRRRLELLLLTDLSATDFLHASWRASWSRGRGYLYSAGGLVFASWYAGRISTTTMGLVAAAGGTLLALDFALGFRHLAQATGGAAVGFVLSVLLPIMAFLAIRGQWETPAMFLPPATIYLAFKSGGTPLLLAGVIGLHGLLALGLLFDAHRRFDGRLRHWYAAHLMVRGG